MICNSNTTDQCCHICGVVFSPHLPSKGWLYEVCLKGSLCIPPCLHTLPLFPCHLLASQIPLLSPQRWSSSYTFFCIHYPPSIAFIKHKLTIFLLCTVKWLNCCLICCLIIWKRYCVYICLCTWQKRQSSSHYLVPQSSPFIHPRENKKAASNLHFMQIPYKNYITKSWLRLWHIHTLWTSRKCWERNIHTSWSLFPCHYDPNCHLFD